MGFILEASFRIHVHFLFHAVGLYRPEVGRWNIACVLEISFFGRSRSMIFAAADRKKNMKSIARKCIVLNLQETCNKSREMAHGW